MHHTELIVLVLFFIISTKNFNEQHIGFVSCLEHQWMFLWSQIQCRPAHNPPGTEPLAAHKHICQNFSHHCFLVTLFLAVSCSTSLIKRRHISSCHGRDTHCTATGRPTPPFTALTKSLSHMSPWAPLYWRSCASSSSVTVDTVTAPAGKFSRLYSMV